jgi:hypothetical protein
VSEQRRDGIQAHPAMDGLGGQRMAQLMRRDAPDPGLGPEPVQGDGDAPRGDRAMASEQEAVGAHLAGPVVGDPVVEQFLQLRMQGDVAVIVKLAHRDPQPIGRADLDHGVDREHPQFAQPHPRPSQQLDNHPGERVRIRPRRSE